MHQITRRIEIDYGHTLPLHMGFCNQLHGHRGIIKVTVTGEIKQVGSETGMVTDFSFLKKLMMEKIHAVLDHGFAVWEKDTQLIDVTDSISISTLQFVQARNKKVLVTEDPPTAEYLAKWCYEQLEEHLPEGVQLVKVKFYETPNNVAKYKKSNVTIGTYQK